MTIIRWEDPPAGGWRWKNVTAELREYPGRWARVLEPTTKADVDNAYNALRSHGCEVTQRKVDGQGIAVWARWPEEDGAIDPQASQRTIDA